MTVCASSLRASFALLLPSLMLLFVAGFCASCAAPPPPSPLASAALEQQFLALNDPMVERYLLGITQRLSSRAVVRGYGAADAHGNTVVKKLLFVRDPKPLALALPNQTLIISDGLLQNLRNEAELAFVMAHELSHLELRHHAELVDTDTSSARQMALEEEADRHAVGIVAAAGYDPRAALGALRVTDAGRSFLSSDTLPSGTHPQARERFFNAMDLIDRSGWLPPGTVNRRDFAAIQRHVRSQS